MEMITPFKPTLIDTAEDAPAVAKSPTFTKNCERTTKNFSQKTLEWMRTFARNFNQTIKKLHPNLILLHIS